MSSTGKVRLEGWLLKKKSGENKMSSLFKQDNLRWFRIQELGTSDEAELALCYYKSRKDSEAKGWIYLRDVTQIRDDRKSFLVVSAARTMTLEAQSQAEHVLWIQTLMNCTPWCAAARERANSSASAQAKDREQDRERDYKRTETSESKKERHRETDPGRDTYANKHAEAKEHDRDDRERERRSHTHAHLHSQSHSRSHSRTASSEDLGEEASRSVNSSAAMPSHPSRGSLTKEDHRLQHVHRGQQTVAGSVSGRLNKFIAGERDPHIYTPPTPREGAPPNTEKDEDEGEEVSLDQQRVRGRAALARKAQREKESDRERERARGSDRSDDDSEDEQKEEEPDEADKRRVVEATGRGREEKEVEESSSSKAKADAAGAQKPVRAMPTAPPPRRARDALSQIEGGSETDTHTQSQRRSLDDVLFRRGSERAEGKEDESSGEEDVDVKAEIQKYAQGAASIGEGENASRPPRPNNKVSQAGTHVSPSSLAHQRMNVGGSRGVPGTPPRPAGNPGTTMDQNFLNEDWDADMDENTRTHMQPAQEKSAGVRVDSNWLDEDFDN